ncbi:MAG: response regulator, partial [Fidelibacterota bacterium]
MNHQPVVLIIDDEESMRDSCSQILTKTGFKTITAKDGSIGLKRIKEYKPDLALVDLKMPGINGLELLNSIRAADPDIISIVITGYPTIDSAVEAMKRGAYDFLPKPFSPQELRIIVERGYEKRTLMLESAQLREEKEQLQDYFITLVSHEIRSPLATVQQNFHTILGGYAGETPSKQKAILEQCNERISAVLKLVEDWLFKERIEQGEEISIHSLVNMTHLLEKVCKEFTSVAEDNRIALNLNLPSGCPLITGNEAFLEVLLSNLLSNGIKYNKAGGKLNVALSWTDDQLRIDVTDSGLGIPKNKIPLIFQEFYRVTSDGS